jgi:hypothetical protein
VNVLLDARSLLRFRADGIPARGQMAWVRVFGQCVVRESGCWEYTRSLNQDGYGSVRVGKREDKVHRIAWSHANGTPVPGGMDICHTCDNPPCCNPAHLFPGTHADNNRDRHTKGRTHMENLEVGRAVLAAKRGALTECVNSHAYPENVRYRQNGARYCGECSRLRSAAYNVHNRDAVNERKRINRASRAKRSSR